MAKYEASAFDDEFQAVDLLQQYEAKMLMQGDRETPCGCR